MEIREWVTSLILCTGVCGGVLRFAAGNAWEKGVRLLCGLILCAVVVLPLGTALKNISESSESLFIIPDYGNRIETQETLLSEELILQNAEERLGGLAREELGRRLGRSDFLVKVSREGTALLYGYGEDFPAEEGRLLLSALLGGCEVELKGEEKLA